MFSCTVVYRTQPCCTSVLHLAADPCGGTKGPDTTVTQVFSSSLQWPVAEGQAGGQQRTRYVPSSSFSFPKDILLADGTYSLFKDTLLSVNSENKVLLSAHCQCPWKERIHWQRGTEIRFLVISSAETRHAVTALPGEAGSAFELLLHFKSLTPSHTAVKENNCKACRDVYILEFQY